MDFVIYTWYIDCHIVIMCLLFDRVNLLWFIAFLLLLSLNGPRDFQETNVPHLLAISLLADVWKTENENEMVFNR